MLAPRRARSTERRVGRDHREGKRAAVVPGVSPGEADPSLGSVNEFAGRRSTAGAGRLPTGRLARTARVGGLVTGQGLRWAGMRTANRVRTPERAAAAERERAAALVHQLVEQLGQMRGAAMKVGQMLSMVEFDGLPEEERDELQRSLAALRDDVPPVRFADLEKLMRQEFGGPLQHVFRDFDERAFAAASIGQVHRARTVDGDDVAVKIQYPGVAEAVDTDLRNATLLLPLVKRLAPGLDAKALAAEMRERIGEELDYELEAQNQRRIERLLRGHPFVRVPRVHTSLSTRRVLVSQYVEGDAWRPSGGSTRRSATASARSSSGSTSGCYRDQIALGTRTPVTICSALTAGSVSWTSACCATSTPPAWPPSGPSPSPSATATRRPSRRPSCGCLSARQPRRCSGRRFRARPDANGDQVVRRPGRAPLSPADARRDLDRERPDREERAAMRVQLNQFTLPPEAILIRRMHGIVAVVLGQLRAGADWGAIAAEYLHGEPPSTPLGDAEAAFLTRRGRTTSAALAAAD